MRRILIFVGIVVVIILAFRFCEFKKGDSATIEYDTNLIQERIVNVGKLVVTEGHFAEVLTYKDQDKYLMDLISFEKKALVIVNAEVTVAYDLRQMKYDIDEKGKTITIQSRRRMNVHCDDRVVGTTPVTIEARPKALKVLVDRL